MQFAFGGSLCRDDGRNGEQGAMTYHGTLQSKSIQVIEGPLHFPGIICHFWSHVGKEACSRWIFHQLLPGSGFFMRVKQRHTGSSLCPQPGLGAQSQPVHVGKQKCTLRNTLASSTTVFYLSHINNEGIYRKGGWGGKSLYAENQWTCALFIPSSKQLPLAWITAQLIWSSVLICCSGRSTGSSLDFSWRYGCNRSVLLGSVASVSISHQPSSTGTDTEKGSSQPLLCGSLSLTNIQMWLPLQVGKPAWEIVVHKYK